MSIRNLDPQEMFINLANAHQPLCQFKASDAAGFESWKKATWPKVLACLGDFPETVDPNPELVCEWHSNGL